jgi:hypothetical protein
MKMLLIVLLVLFSITSDHLLDDVEFEAHPSVVIGCFRVVMMDKDTTGWALYRKTRPIFPYQLASEIVPPFGNTFCIKGHNVSQGAGYEYAIGRTTEDGSVHINMQDRRWVIIPWGAYMPMVIR